MSADATIYVGGLDEKITETLLWELFLQAGPVGRAGRESRMGRLGVEEAVLGTSHSPSLLPLSLPPFLLQLMSTFLVTASPSPTRAMGLWSSWVRKMQTMPSRS